MYISKLKKKKYIYIFFFKDFFYILSSIIQYVMNKKFLPYYLRRLLVSQKNVAMERICIDCLNNSNVYYIGTFGRKLGRLERPCF